MPLPTTLRVLVIHALRSICPKTQIDDINNDARGGFESQAMLERTMHNPILAALAVIAMVVPANAEDSFKSHMIYKMLKGQPKPTPKRPSII